MSRSAAAPYPFIRVTGDGDRSVIERGLAEEIPVALEFNGMGYAVLMATPEDLQDLVAGFLVAERLQRMSEAPPEVALHPIEGGIVARANLSEECARGLLDRVRHRTTDSSCGLCGIESVEQAMRTLPQVRGDCLADDAAVFAALAGLDAHQHLNRETGAAHAAALVAPDGDIRLVREDVGRHNAFDKLIGAMRRMELGWDGGFALLSSRCSYELVEKAALSDCPLLVTISAPTALAVARAKTCGLRLRVLARRDAMLAL